MREAATETLEEGTLVHDYVVEGVLGRGGHGVVYAAYHQDTEEPVALKLLDDDRPDAAKRLRREARAVEALGGPHVPVPIAVETWNGRPLLVMERLRGRDLATLVAEEAPLDANDALALVAQACAPLRRAHARGIVHRDLKPSNLFLHEGEPPRLCVLDFGIAKVLDPEVAGDASLTATGSFLGSPRYVAPEQIRDAKQADPRCDVWALGVVLYELLCGDAPFRATTVHGLCAQIAADEPEPLPSTVPGEVASLAMECLAKDPAARPQDAGELLRRIEGQLGRAPSGPVDGELDATWDGELEVGPPLAEDAAGATVRTSSPAGGASSRSLGWAFAAAAGILGIGLVLRGGNEEADPPAAALPAAAAEAATTTLPSPSSAPSSPTRPRASPSAPATTAPPLRPAVKPLPPPADPPVAAPPPPEFGDPLADRR